MLHLNCCILSLQSLVIFDMFEYTYRVLKYVITMVGFQSILFNMSFKLKSSLWTGVGGGSAYVALPWLKGELLASIGCSVVVSLILSTYIFSTGLLNLCSILNTVGLLFNMTSVHCWRYWTNRSILQRTRFESAALNLMPCYVESRKQTKLEGVTGRWVGEGGVKQLQKEGGGGSICWSSTGFG